MPDGNQNGAGVPLKPLRAFLGGFSTFLPQARLQKKHGFTVFIFHSVTCTPGPFELEGVLAVTPGLFKMQLEWILKNYHPVSPRDMESLSQFPSDACLITFDDGWAGAFEHASLSWKNIPSPSSDLLWQSPVQSLECGYDDRCRFKGRLSKKPGRT